MKKSKEKAHDLNENLEPHSFKFAYHLCDMGIYDVIQPFHLQEVTGMISSTSFLRMIASCKFPNKTHCLTNSELLVNGSNKIKKIKEKANNIK